MQSGGDEGAEEELAGQQGTNAFGTQFVQLVQSSGFQLINVNNVAIQLKVSSRKRRPTSLHKPLRMRHMHAEQEASASPPAQPRMQHEARECALVLCG